MMLTELSDIWGSLDLAKEVQEVTKFSPTDPPPLPLVLLLLSELGNTFLRSKPICLVEEIFAVELSHKDLPSV